MKNQGRIIQWHDAVKKAFITYTDWKGYYVPSPSPSSTYNRYDRFIHKERELITVEPEPVDPPLRELPLPRFNPLVKRGFQGVNSTHTITGGFGNEVLFTNGFRGNYWLSKKDECVSFDADYVYIAGKALLMSQPTNNQTVRAKVVICACFANTITEDDLAAWDVRQDWWQYSVGKRKLIVIRQTVSSWLFYVDIFAWDEKQKDTVSNYPDYSRQIPAEGYQGNAPYMNWVFHGFKTDGKTLVFYKSTYGGLTEEYSEGGIFTMTFSDDYTTQTVVNVGNHHFAELLHVGSEVSGPEGSDMYSNGYHYEGQYSETLAKEGHHILKIYQYKDDFTVLYEHLSEYAFTERYTIDTADNNIVKMLQGSYSEKRDLKVFKIDFEQGVVVDCGKTPISHVNKYTYGSNDTNNVGAAFSTLDKQDTDAKLLFASHVLDLYVYKTCEYSGESHTVPDGTDMQHIGTASYKLVIEHGGVVTVVDTVEKESDAVHPVYNNEITNPKAPYFNGSIQYEAEWFFHNNFKNYAFDGVLLIVCLDLYDSNTNTFMSYRANFRTLIYNVNTKKWQLLDYRVDNKNGDADFPLSVTNL